jgi:hypothetical protein
MVEGHKECPSALQPVAGAIREDRTMKYRLVEDFQHSACGSPAPALGRHRYVSRRIQAHPRAAHGRAVRIE